MVAQRGQTRTTNDVILRGFSFQESVSHPKSPLGDLAARPTGRGRGMRLMAGSYFSGHSSPDVDELGRRLACKLSEETGRRQWHELNGVWVVSVHKKGVVIVLGMMGLRS